MTGWRLGWLLVRDAQLRAAVERLQQSLYICAPAIAQVAAAALYDPPAVAAVVAAAARGAPPPSPPPSRHAHGALLRDDVRAGLDAHVRRYRANAAVMGDALAAAGAEALVPPAGAFYLYAGVGGLLRRSGEADAAALCARLLRDTGVAVTPGDDFDARRGGGYVRLSVCGGGADVAEAAARLTGWAAALGGGPRRRPSP